MNGELRHVLSVAVVIVSNESAKRWLERTVLGLSVSLTIVVITVCTMGNSTIVSPS